MAINFSPSRWGHAIHGETMREKRADRFIDRLIDRWKGRRRYTVMVHTAKPIRAGDAIACRAQRGEVIARVAAVNWCLDPKDMATLEIVIDDKEPQP